MSLSNLFTSLKRSGNFGHSGIPGHRGGSTPHSSGVKTGGATYSPSSSVTSIRINGQKVTETEALDKIGIKRGDKVSVSNGNRMSLITKTGNPNDAQYRKSRLEFHGPNHSQDVKDFISKNGLKSNLYP